MFQKNEVNIIKAAVDVNFLSFVEKGEFLEGAKLLLYTGMGTKETEDCIQYLVCSISQNWHNNFDYFREKIKDEIRENGENNKVYKLSKKLRKSI